MTVQLVDINVLVALFWTNHEQHAAARKWFQSLQDRWATCPLTQAGFVRISSNPRVFPDAPSVGRAAEVLAANLKHPRHLFWRDDLTFADAVAPFGGRVASHQQTTDAYLFGLALHRRGMLTTFDAGVAALADSRQRRSLNLLAV
ncbi:MAG TPA: TA system VapC family ribonuclease toxin [Vicinamibacterales bacterium]|nr:TA system VapC family ribonuclease toxin [Vicinamibacterales bacterium]